MPEAYEEAAIRHWVDHVLLVKGERWPNAAQLAGLAAECAIKSAMVLLPCFVGNDGRLKEGYREHIDTLWDRIPLHNFQGRFPGLIALLRGASNPFHDFAVDQRYFADADLAIDALKRHMAGARRVMGALHLLGTGGEQ